MTYEITDDDIIEVFRAGGLTLAQFGLDELELRYYGESTPEQREQEDGCDLRMVVISDVNGRTEIEEGVPHCENAEDTEEPEERTYEGLGGRWGNGHYLSGGTFSYISDDQDTSRAFFDALYRLFPSVETA